MARMPNINSDNLTPEQKRVCELILSGPRKSIEGPLWVWLASPPLAERAQDYGGFCRFETKVPRRYVEIAILVTGAFWRAGFEWHVHAPAALAAGLSEETIEDIRCGRKPALNEPADAVVYTFCCELLNERKVSDETYRNLCDVIGQARAVELVGVLGYYALVSMTIVTFDVPLPPGARDPFSDV